MLKSITISVQIWSRLEQNVNWLIVEAFAYNTRQYVREECWESQNLIFIQNDFDLTWLFPAYLVGFCVKCVYVTFAHLKLNTTPRYQRSWINSCESGVSIIYLLLYFITIYIIIDLVHLFTKKNVLFMKYFE